MMSTGGQGTGGGSQQQLGGTGTASGVNVTGPGNWQIYTTHVFPNFDPNGSNQPPRQNFCRRDLYSKLLHRPNFTGNMMTESSAVWFEGYLQQHNPTKYHEVFVDRRSAKPRWNKLYITNALVDDIRNLP